MNLEELHTIYKKWLRITDLHRIDIGLAVALTRKRVGTTRVWLIIIGPSGDWKSIQISAMSDKGMGTSTYLLRKLTKNTLVTGAKKAKDLAPELDEKLVLVPEMASILKLDPKEKAQIWAQLRDLFDGIAGGAFGSGIRKEFTGLHVTMIFGSTPVIDTQILIHQDLGTRELCWRTNPDDSIVNQTLNKVWENEKDENLMVKELTEATVDFIKNTQYSQSFDIKKPVKSKLQDFALFLSHMRATAEYDSYQGALLSDVVPEVPTRCLKQLKIIFNSLKSLDPKYSDSEALKVIWKTVKSSCNQKRISVLTQLFSSEEDISTSKIANTLRISYKSVLKELQILWNLKHIKKEDVEVITDSGRSKVIERWSIDESQTLINKFKGLLKHE